MAEQLDQTPDKNPELTERAKFSVLAMVDKIANRHKEGAPSTEEDSAAIREIDMASLIRETKFQDAIHAQSEARHGSQPSMDHIDNVDQFMQATEKNPQPPTSE